MTNTEMLWKYQEAENEYDRLRRELESTPERQKLRKLRRVLQEQTDKIKSFETSLKEKEDEMASNVRKLEALLKDYDLEQDDLNIMLEDEECTAEELTESRKAMEALLEKINALKKAIAANQEWSRATENEIKETYARGAKLKRDYEAAKAVVETEKQERQPVVEKAERDMKALAKQLSPDVLKRYETIKKKHQNPVASLNDNRCTGCGMSVSMTAVRKFSSGSDLVECENCGRLICRRE